MKSVLATLPLWARALMFKAGWFGLVLTPSMAIVPVFVVWFLLVTGFSKTERVTLMVLIGVGLLGDALAVWTGVLRFSSEPAVLGLPGYYLMVWAWFAACWLWCFQHWFGRGVWTVGFSVLMPLAYVGGSQLGQDLHINSLALAGWIPAWWLMFWWSCRQPPSRFISPGAHP